MPDETLLTFAGYLIHQGQLRVVPTFLSALSGSMCGITISYALGRATGYLLIEKYGSRFHIKMEHVHKVHDWYRRLGRFALTFGYFIPGVRHLTAYVAGASELEAPVFALYAYPGALIWTTTFLSLGYLLGDGWERASGEIHRVVFIACGILAALGLAFLAWRRWRRRSGRMSSQGTARY